MSKQLYNRISRVCSVSTMKVFMNKYNWYLDITPNEMFSLYDYPVPGKDVLPLCKIHGKKLEMLEVVIFDREATEVSPPDHCWVCGY